MAISTSLNLQTSCQCRQRFWIFAALTRSNCNYHRADLFRKLMPKKLELNWWKWTSLLLLSWRIPVTATPWSFQIHSFTSSVEISKFQLHKWNNPIPLNSCITFLLTFYFLHSHSSALHNSILHGTSFENLFFYLLFRLFSSALHNFCSFEFHGILLCTTSKDLVLLRRLKTENNKNYRLRVHNKIISTFNFFLHSCN